MHEPDLSQEALLDRIKNRYYPNCYTHANNVVRNWVKYGGFEEVRDLFLEKILNPLDFERIFSTEAFILDSSIDRYYLIEFLIEQGMLDRENLEGKVIDIGCHVGATVDALGMYGGEVVGADNGRYAYESPSGRPISRMEGRSIIRSYSSRDDKPTLVSCFNVGWVEDMSYEGFAFDLCQDSLSVLKPNGQVLYTLSNEDLEKYRKLNSFPNSQLIQLPEGLNKRDEYAFTLRKEKWE
jgi:hypothetical protein